MSRISDLHSESAPDRADDAESECRRLQGIIDRIAGALGTFDTARLFTISTEALSLQRRDLVLAAKKAIEDARAILSETGDFPGDYPECQP